MIYKHTQRGDLIIFVLIAVALLFGFIWMQADFDNNILIVYAVILFILASFATLNVTINESQIKIKFGYGIYRKKFPIQEITEAKAVKNHWYFGWGIRYWPFPSMWIYNVSGFDAVEIKLQNGKTYRIGTDNPKALEQAIKSLIN